MISVSTLGEHKLHETMFATCSNHKFCGVTRELDIDVLIERFGEDFDVVDNRARIVRALRCKECGARASGIMSIPNITMSRM